MSDTQAPELTGLTLPGVVDLGAGDATITYSAKANDDTGVASVWIMFDRQIIGSAGPTATWLMREEFGEDFGAGPISRDLLVSRTNSVGPVAVTNVTVYDDAGNSRSYSTTDLQGLGLPTGFILTNAVPDTAPPVLTGLTLPGIVDVTAGDVPASYSVSATDDSGVESVWLTFERPASGTNAAANRWFVYDGAGEDWSAGALSRTIYIRGDTAPGHVVLYSVTVQDIAGKSAVYERPDLLALGLPLGFEVVNDTVVADFALDADVTQAGLTFSLTRAGDALAAPLIGLVLRLDAPEAAMPTTALAVPGALSQTVDPEGDAQILRVMADVSATVGQDGTVLDITLPAPAATQVAVLVLGIEVDGALAYLPDPPRILAGTGGNDTLAPPPAASDPLLVLGGPGQDTLSGGTGADTLTGGTGADEFAAAPGGGTDRITDFADGTDLLDLTAYSEAVALQALGAATTTSDGTQVILPGGTTLLLDGIAPGALDIADTTFDSTPPPPSDTVWEVRRLTLTGTEQVVELAHTFANPVAIARAPSLNDATPVAVRITEVTGTSVRLSLQRPDYLTGAHPAEEVMLIVAEAGSYMVGDGTIVQAGTLEADRQGRSVTFDTPFATAPAIFSQVQSDNDPDFVVTRDFASDQIGFDVALQEEQAAPNPQGRIAETVGWLAVSTGSDTLGSAPGDPGGIEAGRLGTFVTNDVFSASFQTDLGDDPSLLASLASFNGSDPAFLRLPDITGSGFDVFVQEEQSKDVEMYHVAEDVHYLAIEREGTTRGRALEPPALEQLGEVFEVAFDHDFATFTFSKAYTSPVVFAQPLSFAGFEPAATRIVDITSNSVTLYAQEPAAYDGWHLMEVASLLVIEAGRHLLQDGTVIEVGTLTTNLLSPEGFAQVEFEESFSSTPAIVSQVQSRNGWDFVVTRQTDATAHGFAVTMQEEERLNSGFHANEEIGWLAIEHGSGTWSGIDYEAGTTGQIVGDQGGLHGFDAAFDSAPNLIAGLSSFRGSDPAMLRTIDVTPTGFESAAQEETSLDAETWHFQESVDYLALGGDGILWGDLDGAAPLSGGGSGNTLLDDGWLLV